MNVAAILKSKGSEVETATASTPLLQIVEALSRRRIGAIVVVEGDRNIAGIVSERDIIRALAKSGSAVLSQPVSQIMTRHVVSCDEADTLDELMAAMTAGRFRHLPVARDGKLIGIVSIGDVVKNHISEVEMEHSAMREYIAHT